jgi:hypothetical protein
MFRAVHGGSSNTAANTWRVQRRHAAHLLTRGSNRQRLPAFDWQSVLDRFRIGNSPSESSTASSACVAHSFGISDKTLRLQVWHSRPARFC